MHLQAYLDNIEGKTGKHLESLAPEVPNLNCMRRKIDMNKVAPNPWFDHNAKELVDFYLSVFPDGKPPLAGMLRKLGANIQETWCI